MKKPGVRAAVVLLAFLITASGMSAENDNGLVSYRLVSEIGDDLQVSDTLLVEVPADTKTAHLSVPPATDVLYVRNPYGPLRYAIGESGKLEIQNISTGPYTHKNEIEVGMTSGERIARKGNALEYVLVFSPAQNASSFEHTVKVPGASSRIVAVVPQAEMLQENGRMVVYWKPGSVGAKGGPTVFLVRFVREESKLFDYALAALALVSFGLLAGRAASAAFKEYRRRKLVFSFGLLNEKDEKVLAAVVKSGKDGIPQGELLRGTQYTKSNLSKIINRLEARGLLEKRKNGKMQRVLPGPKLKI